MLFNLANGKAQNRVETWLCSMPIESHHDLKRPFVARGKKYDKPKPDCQNTFSVHGMQEPTVTDTISACASLGSLHTSALLLDLS